MRCTLLTALRVRLPQARVRKKQRPSESAAATDEPESSPAVRARARGSSADGLRLRGTHLCSAAPPQATDAGGGVDDGGDDAPEETMRLLVRAQRKLGAGSALQV